MNDEAHHEEICVVCEEPIDTRNDTFYRSGDDVYHSRCRGAYLNSKHGYRGEE